MYRKNQIWGENIYNETRKQLNTTPQVKEYLLRLKPVEEVYSELTPVSSDTGKGLISWVHQGELGRTLGTFLFQKVSREMMLKGIMWPPDLV